MCICASFYEYDGCCTYRIPSTPLPPSLPPSTTTQFNVYKVLLLAASQDVCLYFRLTTLAVLHLFALERLYSDFYVRVDARLPHAAATAILLTPSTLAVLHVASTCHLPHPFGHWPCQSQSHAPLLSLHARALTPFECHTGRRRWARAWQWKARMAVRSTAVGLLGLSSFDCRVSGAPSTKDALHFNEDIRRCDSVSVATPASSLVSTDCR